MTFQDATYREATALVSTVSRPARPQLADALHGTAPAHVAFFAPEVTDVSTIKRAQSFVEHGLSFTVFSFRRDRYNPDYTPSWPLVELGMTEDGNYRQRLVAMLRALRIVYGHRRQLSRASVLYARNIDQLMLALFARPFAARGAMIVYEVLDVVPAFTSAGKAGKAFRALERLCLRAVDLLVLSSPGFMKNFYKPVQGYANDWFLLENKLMPLEPGQPSEAPAMTAAERRRAEGWRWIVGYFGLIRGDRTFEVMTALAERFPDILFLFRGIVTTVDRERFDATLARLPNMVYEGPYVNPDDLTGLYAQADLVWALDLENEEHNSRWLMPCRFYEGGLHGVPLLAAEGFEVGERVAELDIGWTFKAPYEVTVGDFLAAVTPEAVDEKRGQLATLPRETFVAGSDVKELCRRLATGERVRNDGLTGKEAPAT